MVTASHNPAADNGYKVYLGDGAQIVPPHDTAIAACIDAFDPCSVQPADADHPLIEHLDASPASRYVQSVPSVRLRPELGGVAVAYTAMHGVGGATLLRAFGASGFPAPHVVDAQQQPDPDFPTVAFPNPEEPGAMDLLLERARESHALLALANDPDADRLGAAIPAADGDWRRLAGDELGWLLADHILEHTTGDDRLVVTTLVSSSMLSRMAANYGVHFKETFTGFKCYLVANQPMDKDGISAAVLMAEVAALAASEGVSLQDRLDALAARYGRHITAEQSVRLDPVVAIQRVAALRDTPPAEIAGRTVTEVEWFDEAGLLRIWLDDIRLQVRPSGTEPKVKLYGEAIGQDPAPWLGALAYSGARRRR